MSESYFLQTDRLGLRILEEEDAEECYAWLNDPEVCQYNAHHRFPQSLERERAYIRGVGDDRSALVFAMIELESKKHIGNISLQSINYIDRSAEIAILCGRKELWGKGYALEAYRELILYGFSTLNLHRIFMGTMEGNLRMQRLAKHAGFREEGRRRDAIYKAGAYHDVIEYGILNKENVQK